MQVEDLKTIFEPQIREGTYKLYYMLIDGSRAEIGRHPADQLEELAPHLTNFRFEGYKPGNMARFVK